MDKVLELWQNYYIGRTNVIYERYKFNNRSQEANESIDAYTTALRTLAETCEFSSLKDDLIRDRLVCGIRDNGLRKKLLQEPKLTLKKCLDTDVYLSLLDWRNTPSEGMSSSPAQRMFGRRTRTLLPTTSSLLKPKVQGDVKEKLTKQKSKQVKYYNQTSKELPPLKSGEIVRVAPKQGDRERKWFKARVEEQVDIRSYEVRTEDGKLYKRNRRHLRQSKEPFAQTTEASPVVQPQHNQTNTSSTTAEPTRPKATGQPVQNSPVDLPKQTEPVTVAPSQEPPPTTKPTVVTRSGRVSRAPQYLQDFVTVR